MMGRETNPHLSLRREVAEQIYGYVQSRERQGVSLDESMAITCRGKEYVYKFKYLLRVVDQFFCVLNGRWIHLYYARETGKPQTLEISVLPPGDVADKVHAIMIFLIKETLVFHTADSDRPPGSSRESKATNSSSSGCYRLDLSELDPPAAEHPPDLSLAAIWKKMHEPNPAKSVGGANPLVIAMPPAEDNTDVDLR